MKIKDLIKICESAPDKERNVYIPHTHIAEISKTVMQSTETNIGYNFDDNNDIELYITAEEKCEHICSGNCRREGCNCECGEWHKDKKS